MRYSFPLPQMHVNSISNFTKRQNSNVLLAILLCVCVLSKANISEGRNCQTNSFLYFQQPCQAITGCVYYLCVVLCCFPLAISHPLSPQSSLPIFSNQLFKAEFQLSSEFSSVEGGFHGLCFTVLPGKEVCLVPLMSNFIFRSINHIWES